MPRIRWEVRAIRAGSDGRTLAVLEADLPDDLEPGDVLTVVRPTRCPLTQGQLDIVEGLSEGLSYKEIAAERGVGTSTIRSTMNSIYAKLEMSGDRAQVVLRARDEGWLS